MTDHYHLHTYILRQPQQVLSLGLGEQVETVKIRDNYHQIQHDVTTDNVVITHYLNSRLIDHLHWINLYQTK